MAQPDNIANGQFLDATLVQAWFDYLLTLIQALAPTFEPFANLTAYLAVNPTPGAGAAYFDQSLGYAVILLQDGLWHGLQNS